MSDKKPNVDELLEQMNATTTGSTMTPSGMTPSGMTPSGMTPSGMTPGSMTNSQNAQGNPVSKTDKNCLIL